MLPDDMLPGLAVVALAINQTWAAVMVNVIPNRGIEVDLNFRVTSPVVDEAFSSVFDLAGDLENQVVYLSGGSYLPVWIDCCTEDA